MLLSQFATATEDSLFIENFRGHKVFYADLGYSVAPFYMHYKFKEGLDKLVFKNNFKPSLGFGFAYKWFSLRVSFPILDGFRNKTLYGDSKQFNVGFDYTFKKMYLDAEFKSVLGYALKDANRFDSTFTEATPNSILPNTQALNVAINAWYFQDPNFKMNALIGKRAHYLKQVNTWYVKGTMNVFGIGNDGNSIIPIILQSPTNTKLATNKISAFDIGVVPGYAYVNRIKNWQFSGWFGLGGVIQSKFYVVNEEKRGFLGLAPRYDVRVMGGYSTPQYFVFLLTDFDNKSIRFSDLIFRQYYYSVKLVGGMRFKDKKTVKKKKSKGLFSRFS